MKALDLLNKTVNKTDKFRYRGKPTFIRGVLSNRDNTVFRVDFKEGPGGTNAGALDMLEKYSNADVSFRYITLDKTNPSKPKEVISDLDFSELTSVGE